MQEASLEAFNEALKCFLLSHLQNCCILNKERAPVKKLLLTQVLPALLSCQTSGLVSRQFGADCFNCFLI